MNGEQTIQQFKEVINLKLVFLKILKYWYVYLLAVLLGFVIAHEYNKRQANIYQLDTLISVKDESNPYFTSNMSLVFNWGGPSDKVNTIITLLKSRGHNESLVRKLKYYITYYRKGKYFDTDIYGRSPFRVEDDPGAFQAVDVPFKITFTGPDTFVLETEIAKDTKNIKLFNYATEQSKTIPWDGKNLKKTYRLGEHIDTPFFHGRITAVEGQQPETGKPYYFKFRNFHSVVNRYRNLYVGSYKKNSSMVILKLKGRNKKKIQDYLNTSVDVLSQKLLRDKNSFATNTINFIDTTLNVLKNELVQSGKRLEKFQQNKMEFALDNPSEALYNQLLDLDRQKQSIASKRLYYRTLQDYMDSNRFKEIPSPSVVGIDDPMILSNTKKLAELAIKREQLQQVLGPGAAPLQELNNEMANVKKALQNSIRSALSNLDKQESFVQARINKLERKLNTLPAELKRFIDLKRDYQIKDQIYSYLLQKRNEVNIIKASNLSGVKIIDSAKDTGQGPVAPNRKINYLLALMLALIIPSLIILVFSFVDDKIHDIEEVRNLTKLRIIGTIFHSDNASKNKLPVLSDQAGTHIRESFSTLRTNLRFQLPVRKGKGNVVIVTSTTSGEGKTFVSSNLAAINALSNQKTAILEFDVRKPKSHHFFTVDERRPGITDYILNEQLTPADIVRPTHEVENLDLVLAGTPVDNATRDISGLLESERLQELFDYLLENYKMIIIDSPPLGLVPDALILNRFADYMLYVVRENYSKRNFLKVIDEYVENGEIPNVGIVYNDYRIDMIKKYGYQSKYVYTYNKYGYKKYGPSSDRPSILKKIFRLFKK
ncbi:MAG: polysaccharide biosynthesis tyrosine autokinase [Chlorobi bacterium]|nr:polysaccharide biosynthesis tyrosine autokinase [Chlorobiota bacterium]